MFYPYVSTRDFFQYRSCKLNWRVTWHVYNLSFIHFYHEFIAVTEESPLEFAASAASDEDDEEDEFAPKPDYSKARTAAAHFRESDLAIRSCGFGPKWGCNGVHTRTHQK